MAIKKNENGDFEDVLSRARSKNHMNIDFLERLGAGAQYDTIDEFDWAIFDFERVTFHHTPKSSPQKSQTTQKNEATTFHRG